MVEQADMGNGCCGETTATNPKTDFRGKRVKSFDLYGLQNPIQQEVEDAAELKAFFAEWNFVPYAGTTTASGQSLLVWYNMLANLSPTTGACIRRKAEYAFGSKAMFVAGGDWEYDLGEERQELSLSEKVAYRDALRKYINFSGDTITQFHTKAGKSLLRNGNVFIEVVFVKESGEMRCNFKWHKTQNVLYVNTPPGEAKVTAISPIWETRYLKKNPARLVPIYPLMAAANDGSMRTMFHLKEGENPWYGRPASESSDIYKFREVQDAIYLTKQAANNFTGQLIVEVEDDDPEANAALNDDAAQNAGFAGFVDRFEQNYTQKGDDPQTVVVTARPYGSRPMFVFQVKPNTNEKWYDVTGKIAKEHIYRGEGVTARFMGEDVSGGFSQDQFVSDYVINVEPEINALRTKVLAFTNDMLNKVWGLLGMDFSHINVTFAPPIQSAIEAIKTGQSKNTQ